MFGLQALFYTSVHVKMADFYASLIGSPLVIVVVTVFVGADASETLSVAQRWERIVERAWAIIILDVGLSFVQLSGLETMLTGTRGAGDAIMGLLTLLLSAMLVYAEPFIALEKDAQPLTVLPFAVLRSMMLGWVNISRIFSLFAVQIAAIIAAQLVQAAAMKFAPKSAVWADMAIGTILCVPLAALYAVAYLDTLSQERESARR